MHEESAPGNDAPQRIGSVLRRDVREPIAVAHLGRIADDPDEATLAGGRRRRAGEEAATAPLVFLVVVDPERFGAVAVGHASGHEICRIAHPLALVEARGAATGGFEAEQLRVGVHRPQHGVHGVGTDDLGLRGADDAENGVTAHEARLVGLRRDLVAPALVLVLGVLRIVVEIEETALGGGAKRQVRGQEHRRLAALWNLRRGRQAFVTAAGPEDKAAEQEHRQEPRQGGTARQHGRGSPPHRAVPAPFAAVAPMQPEKPE
jgi:hypothetical protein